MLGIDVVNIIAVVLIINSQRSQIVSAGIFGAGISMDCLDIIIDNAGGAIGNRGFRSSQGHLIISGIDAFGSVSSLDGAESAVSVIAQIIEGIVKLGAVIGINLVIEDLYVVSGIGLHRDCSLLTSD